MNELDWGIVVLVGLSVVMGMVRGVTKEILGIVAWVLGLWLAFKFATLVGGYFPESMPRVSRDMAGFATVLIITLIGVGLLGKLLRMLMGVANLGFEDYLLGALFGALRGVVVVGVILFVAGIVKPLTQTTYWQTSTLIPYFEEGLVKVKPYMPEWIQDLKRGSDEKWMDKLPSLIKPAQAGTLDEATQRSLARQPALEDQAMHMSHQALHDAMLRGKAPVILDVREPNEFASGHIPGAINVPLSTLTPGERLDMVKTMQEPIVVYCRSGVRSLKAQKILQASGYTQVYDGGGILDWPFDTTK